MAIVKATRYVLGQYLGFWMGKVVTYRQCDQTERFIGLWASF